MVKIKNESIKERKVAPPPPAIHIYMPGKKGFLEEKYHKLGLKKFDKIISSDEKKVETGISNDIDFFIKENAFDKMLLHCYEMALNGNEALGFMIGDVRKWDNEYSLVYDVVTAPLESSPIYVRFSREAFEELFDKLDEIEYEYIILGWYHSHVGYTSFMSNIDLETQRKYFNKPFHASIVIDPINMETKAFKLMDSKCIEIPYAIFM